MDHIKALGIKFIRFLFNFYIFIGLVFNQPFMVVVEMSLLLSVMSYLLGDLFILPRFGMKTATVSDFILTFLGIWLVTKAFGVPVHVFVFTMISIFITIEEFVYHVYVEKVIYGRKMNLNRMINKI
ncbi:DUF2512 family protein [Aneurinibacillus terranovensis]|uniref:DUF2512 family protein n=1 Tax=Aneurinibacillus terranovensis TaxID=278991 RepID=UPI0003F755A2|nr:DUF2512 family protein [Aneurinibacillus terranovensis]